MRGDRGGDARVAGERLDQFLDARKALVEVLVVGRVEIGERLADDAAHPGLVDDAADLGLEIVHVGNRGDPAADHLQCRQAESRLPPRAGVTNSRSSGRM